ncbi:MAG: hypothetical protein QOC92_3654 [Acidimicrobiaceae bacterium]
MAASFGKARHNPSSSSVTQLRCAGVDDRPDMAQRGSGEWDVAGVGHSSLHAHGSVSVEVRLAPRVMASSRSCPHGLDLATRPRDAVFEGQQIAHSVGGTAIARLARDSADRVAELCVRGAALNE